MSVNDPSGVDAAHLRIADLVQQLYGRPYTDSDTVVAELAEHAAVEIPGADYAGITVPVVTTMRDDFRKATQRVYRYQGASSCVKALRLP